MKKSTLETMISYLHGNTVDTAALLTELEAEQAKLTEKARANAALYEAAIPTVLAALTDEPQTSKELFAACEAELPEGFSQSKLNYLLRTALADKVHTNRDQKVNTYTRL